ncbi:MAG: chitobiase/beta-hexosaminidase C-terminal domain-containing protein [Chromatiaceae bacterium]
MQHFAWWRSSSSSIRWLKRLSIAAVAAIAFNTSAAEPASFSWTTDSHQVLYADLTQDGVIDLLLQAKNAGHPHFLLAGTGRESQPFDVRQRMELPATIQGRTWYAGETALVAIKNQQQRGAKLLLISSKTASAFLFETLAKAADLSKPSRLYQAKQHPWLLEADKARFYAGDFDGDGQQDLLLLHTETGAHQVLPFDKNNQFKTARVVARNSSWGKTERIIIRDFNQDGTDDVFALSKDGHTSNYLVYGDKQNGFKQAAGKAIHALHANLSWADNKAGIRPVLRKSTRQPLLFRAYNAYEQSSANSHCLGWLYDTETDQTQELCNVPGKVNVVEKEALLTSEVMEECPIEQVVPGRSLLLQDCNPGAGLPRTPWVSPQVSNGSVTAGSIFSVTVANTNDVIAVEYNVWAKDQSDGYEHIGGVAALEYGSGIEYVTTNARISRAGTFNVLYRVCNWNGCSGFSPASTSVNVQAAPVIHRVTASAGGNGSISPAFRDVLQGQTTTFTVTPSSGYTAAASGCAGQLVGTTYTTGPIVAPCNVSASFTAIPLQQVSNVEISPSSGTYSGSVSVSLSSATAGATIRYSTNGADINASSPVYSAPFTLSANTTVKARAFKAGMTDSSQTAASFVVNPLPQVSNVAISPNGGSHSGSVSVSLSSATAGATIRYSIDGTDISTSSLVYTSPFTLSASATVKARAFKSGMADSAQTSASFVVNPLPQVSSPQMSPNGGTYTGSVLVSLSSATAGATIRYSTDGADISASSPVYSAPFTLSASTTVKARAFKANMADSSQAAASFVVNPIPRVGNPVISPNGGTHAGAVLVSLSSATAGATIRYSTNGADISASSPVYAAPFTLTASATVKARAFKAGMTDSGQTAANFNFTTTDKTSSFSYDARGRLVGATDNNDLTMQQLLDDGHNRTTVEVRTISANLPRITLFSAPDKVSAAGATVQVQWASQNTNKCSLQLLGSYNQQLNLPVSGSTNIQVQQATAMMLQCSNGQSTDVEGKIIRIGN